MWPSKFLAALQNVKEIRVQQVSIKTINKYKYK